MIAGPGEGLEAMQKINPALRNKLVFLGRINDAEKASFLKSLDLYVAPNTGGESFGIILAEALASGVPIVASDIQAFRYLLEDGKYGQLFENENSKDLARKVITLLKDQKTRDEMSASGVEYARRFDWPK